MRLSCVPLVAVVGFVHACYITNCPPGGKRAPESDDRLCPRCGPSNRGFCYSPSICCTENSCVINEALLSCRAEALRGRACQAPGKLCGLRGHCAIRGFCCDADGCKKDDSCDSDQLDSDMDIFEYSFSKR